MEYSWEKPLCLIENSDTDGLCVNEHTLAELSKVKNPVSVVSIVGPYRTGKSYLLNLLAGRQTGFSLGSTVQAKTKGIWAWIRPDPNNKGQSLLLLDTEGLGDVAKGDKNHDNWIFALAVLLSNILVYNSIGTIDQTALDDLHFVAEMCEHVKVKANTAEEGGLDFDAFFPDFIWTIRDFTLELKRDDGKSITPTDYLKSALVPKEGLSKKIDDYNRPRNCIRTFFRSHECFTFPRPVEVTDLLKDLELLDKSALEPKFISVSDQFIKYVKQQLKPKTMVGRAVTGRVAAQLAKYYVEAIRGGAIPCIENAVQTAAKRENENALKESVEVYKSMMNEKLPTEKLPTESWEQLSQVHHECEQAATATFLASAIFDSDLSFQSQMKDQVTKVYESISNQNKEASTKKCTQVLDSLYGTITAKAQAGEFARPGGYKVYKNEMTNLEKKYEETPGKGVMAKDMLQTFMDSKKAKGNTILAADKNLKAEQKKTEEEKRKAEEYKRQQLVEEEKRKEAQQRLIDEEKSYKQHVKQLVRKMDNDRDSLLAEQEYRIEKRIREHGEMLERGFRRQASDMRREIDRLKEELEQEKQKPRGTQLEEKMNEVGAAELQKQNPGEKKQSSGILGKIGNAAKTAYNCTLGWFLPNL